MGQRPFNGSADSTVKTLSLKQCVIRSLQRSMVGLCAIQKSIENAFKFMNLKKTGCRTAIQNRL